MPAFANGMYTFVNLIKTSINIAAQEYLAHMQGLAGQIIDDKTVRIELMQPVFTTPENSEYVEAIIERFSPTEEATVPGAPIQDFYQYFAHH